MALASSGGDLTDYASIRTEVKENQRDSIAKGNNITSGLSSSNYGSDKATGHLGSFLYKKCETAIALEPNTVHKDNITVNCKLSRGYSFESFDFSVNKYGLPFVVGNIYDPLKDYIAQKPKHVEIPF